MKSIFLYALFLFHFISSVYGQIQWSDPLSASFPVICGQGSDLLQGSFYRLPDSLKGQVREPLWNLSRNSAGLSLSFYTDAPEIKVRYGVRGAHSMPHMPATGVSGVDLYRTDCHGEIQWCSGRFSFGDTLVYSYSDLSDHNYHKKGYEYTLYLPLYNEVSFLNIGVPAGRSLEFIPVTSEKPIVVYGTSIAQGACASRPGMAWTNIIQRRSGTPVVNLGFSGNGQLEAPIFNFMASVNARLYIIDCMPNMTNERASLIYDRVIQGVHRLRADNNNTPILLVEHCGYTGSQSSDARKEDYERTNKELRRAYERLLEEKVPELYYMTTAEQGLSPDSQVDGVHATDLGMENYASGYLRKINPILNRIDSEQEILQPRKQRREPDNYEWNVRHEQVLKRNAEIAPEILMIGNSITHFWGGEPAGPRQSGADSWNSLFKGKRVTNMGYGWDRIENVLWRIYHGELDGFRAQKVFLMIGTNNLEKNTNEEIVTGIAELGRQIRLRQPDAQLYVVSIYPRRGQEERISKLNSLVRDSLSGIPNMQVIHISGELLNKQGLIREELFSDGLHPNEKGYRKLAAALKKYLE